MFSKISTFSKNFYIDFSMKIFDFQKIIEKPSNIFSSADKSKRAVRQDKLMILLRVFNYDEHVTRTIISVIFEVVRLRKVFLRE